MSDLTDMITSQLGAAGMRQLSEKIGGDQSATEKAVNGALPTLFGALARNASTSEGASSLQGALEKDHGGGVLDDLGGFLGKGDSDTSFGGSGNGILGHLLGAKRGAVESGLSQASGLDKGATSQLMTTLAPMVMAALGRQAKGMDAGGLASMLGAEREKQDKEPAFGFIGKLLDQDGDGGIIDDLAGKFFG